MNSEQRKDHRKQLKYPARVDLRDGSPPRPCLLRDISSAGARLFIDAADEVPDHFLLLLTKGDGAARDCRVVWRDGNQIGLEFLKTPAPKPLSSHAMHSRK